MLLTPRGAGQAPRIRKCHSAYPPLPAMSPAKRTARAGGFFASESPSGEGPSSAEPRLMKSLNVGFALRAWRGMTPWIRRPEPRTARSPQSPARPTPEGPKPPWWVVAPREPPASPKRRRPAPRKARLAHGTRLLTGDDPLRPHGCRLSPNRSTVHGCPPPSLGKSQCRNIGPASGRDKSSKRREIPKDCPGYQRTRRLDTFSCRNMMCQRKGSINNKFYTRATFL